MPPTFYGFPDPRKVLEWQETAPATAFLSGLGRLLLPIKHIQKSTSQSFSHHGFARYTSPVLQADREAQLGLLRASDTHD